MTEQRKSEKPISYRDAMKELEEILAGIEAETVDVDELAGKVKRAAELLDLCKGKILRTEQEVKKITERFGESGAGPEEEEAGK